MRATKILEKYLASENAKWPRALAAEREWRPIETAPEGEHVMLWWPEGERGIGGIECATIFRGDPHSSTGMSFWTHGGPNSGTDWEPRNSEKPTHWQPLPSPPGQKG